MPFTDSCAHTGHSPSQAKSRHSVCSRERGKNTLADLHQSPEPAGSSTGRWGDLHELGEGVNSKPAEPASFSHHLGRMGAWEQGCSYNRTGCNLRDFFPSTNKTLRKRKRLFKVRSNSSFLDSSSKNTVWINSCSYLAHKKYDDSRNVYLKETSTRITEAELLG